MTRSLRASVPARAPRPAPVVVRVRPDAEVWARALVLAGGDVRRCRVLDARTVLVANRPT